MQKRVGLLVCFFPPSLEFAHIVRERESTTRTTNRQTDNQREYHLRGGPRT